MKPVALGIAALGAVAVIGVSLLLIPPRARDPQATEIGGPFTLTDGSGRRVTQADFRGEWQLVYFGYTHCPDACPTTLAALGGALDKLPGDARRHVRVLFVTVDPARDTPAVVGSYVKAFGPEFVGLTGSQADLLPVEQSFRVYARRHDLPGGDYTMDHSSIIYVMRPDGSFAGLLDDSMAPADMAKSLSAFGA